MILRIRLLLVLIAASQFAPGSALALKFVGDPLDLRELNGIEIADGYAYVVRRSRTELFPTLEILDLSDPVRPVKVGSFDTEWGSQVLEIHEKIALVGDNLYGRDLRLLDITTPTAPFELGSFTATNTPGAVAVSGTTAYLAGEYGLGDPNEVNAILRVLDISNPTSPVQVAEFFHRGLTDVAAAGDYGYVADRGGLRLTIYDASNPTAPIQAGQLFSESGLAAKIAWSDGYVFGAGGGMFQAIDVRDSASPVEVGRTPIGPGIVIDVVGQTAFLGGSGFNVVDVSNPTIPSRRGSLYTPLTSDLAISGGYGYLASDAGLAVVDLSVPDKPVQVGTTADGSVFWTPVGGNDVVIANGLAYLGTGSPLIGSPLPDPVEVGLHIIDVSDPREPVEIGRIVTGDGTFDADGTFDVELVGNLVYLAAGTDGLKIVDVTDPAAPSVVGGIALPGSIAAVKVVGSHAFLIDRGGTFQPGIFRVLDLSTPTQPTLLASVGLWSEFLRRCIDPDLAIVGHLAYAVCEGTLTPLTVIDIANPAEPARVFHGSPRGSGIHVEGDFAYVSSPSNYFTVLDVSNPALPVVIATRDVAGGSNVHVENGFAYLAGLRGLAVYDVADPTEPFLLGGYPADAGAWNGVALADGLVFGATRAGLQIVDLGPEYRRVRSVDVAIRAAPSVARRNLASRGVMSVAVLGAADFDASEIDRSTLRFGPSLAAPTEADGGILADVNDDGRVDLLSHFRTAETGIAATDTQACVTGQTLDGSAIEGCGSLGAKPRRR